MTDKITTKILKLLCVILFITSETEKVRAQLEEGNPFNNPSISMRNIWTPPWANGNIPPNGGMFSPGFPFHRIPPPQDRYWPSEKLPPPPSWIWPRDNFPSGSGFPTSGMPTNWNRPNINVSPDSSSPSQGIPQRWNWNMGKPGNEGSRGELDGEGQDGYWPESGERRGSGDDSSYEEEGGKYERGGKDRKSDERQASRGNDQEKEPWNEGDDEGTDGNRQERGRRPSFEEWRRMLTRRWEERQRRRQHPNWRRGPICTCNSGSENGGSSNTKTTTETTITVETKSNGTEGTEDNKYDQNRPVDQEEPTKDWGKSSTPQTPSESNTPQTVNKSSTPRGVSESTTLQTVSELSTPLNTDPYNTPTNLSESKASTGKTE